ncbi:uncharacterized protein LOC123529670 [Mercenaria mercenaria]|uniref:uncharacterized protein LOC123529670 n=1 Tax=Mercenaria mercenaria TaxID=6596 RepID=UPI001E1DEF7F|nr:uncharacterized protein LOC123529670 [Mercenaria mercenaria]
MMAYLQIFVLAVVTVAVLAQDCDPANCPSCPNGEAFCDHHGGCHCHHHVARAASHCTTDSDCSGTTCGHGEKAICETLHGSGGGSGENGCKCVHHKRLVTVTEICTTATDCSQWGSSNCAKNEKVACEMAHGTGVGGGEMNCVCKSSHKRAATGCCNADDCDATSLGCDPHHEVASCVLAHGSGGQCSENTCKCSAKHG